MGYETELTNFLEKTLNYVENNGANQNNDITDDTAKKYRSAAAHNLLDILKSLTRKDIENRLGDRLNSNSDRKRAAVLLAQAFSTDELE